MNQKPQNIREAYAATTVAAEMVILRDVHPFIVEKTLPLQRKKRFLSETQCINVEKKQQYLRRSSLTMCKSIYLDWLI